jgi:hypothetical protein
MEAIFDSLTTSCLSALFTFTLFNQERFIFLHDVALRPILHLYLNNIQINLKIIIVIIITLLQTSDRPVAKTSALQHLMITQDSRP